MPYPKIVYIVWFNDSTNPKRYNHKSLLNLMSEIDVNKITAIVKETTLGEAYISKSTSTPGSIEFKQNFEKGVIATIHKENDKIDDKYPVERGIVCHKRYGIVHYIKSEMETGEVLVVRRKEKYLIPV